MKEPKNLIDKVKLIKKLLGKPYHLFFYTTQGRAVFRIEDKNGNFLFWEGPFMAAAVEEGMSYLRHEVEMGAVKELKEEKKDANKKDE